MAKPTSVCEKLAPVSGRDEMNLAEFALGLASDRNVKQLKTIERKQTVFLSNGTRLEQAWTVTGSDKHGLPRAGDDDVLLALLKLASDRGFSDRQVFFTRYELMQILEWPPNGRNYQRFEASLERLTGVRIIAKNSFWDNSRKGYTSLNFGLIDDYAIMDRASRSPDLDALQLEMPLTHVSFNEKFFHSMQIGNVKRLDMRLYNSLSSALSKRLYRYLDKRRYKLNVFDVEMVTLATVNLGLDLTSKRYPSQIKQLLDPAHLELQEKGFLGSWTYRWSEDRDIWFIKYTFSKSAHSPQETVQPPSELFVSSRAMLLQRGFSSALATRLAKDFADRIPSKIDMYDQLVQSKSKLLTRNPVGWLRKAIEDDYQQVRGYEPPEERQKKEARSKVQKDLQLETERRTLEDKDLLWAIYTGLPSERRESIVARAKHEFRFLSADKLNTLNEDSPVLRGAILAFVQEEHALSA